MSSIEQKGLYFTHSDSVTSETLQVNSLFEATKPWRGQQEHTSTLCGPFFTHAEEIAASCGTKAKKFLKLIGEAAELLGQFKKPPVGALGEPIDLTEFTNTLGSLFADAPVTQSFLSQYIARGERNLNRHYLVADNLRQIARLADKKTPAGKAFAHFERRKNQKSDRALVTALIRQTISENVFDIRMCDKVSDAYVRGKIAEIFAHELARTKVKPAYERQIDRLDDSTKQVYEEVEPNQLLYLLMYAHKYGIGRRPEVRTALKRLSGTVLEETINHYAETQDKDTVSAKILRNRCMADSIALHAIVASDKKPADLKYWFWWTPQQDGTTGNWLPKDAIPTLPLLLVSVDKTTRNQLIQRFQQEVALFEPPDIADIINQVSARQKEYRAAQKRMPSDAWESWQYAPVFLFVSKDITPHFSSVMKVLHATHKQKESKTWLN